MRRVRVALLTGLLAAAVLIPVAIAFDWRPASVVNGALAAVLCRAFFEARYGE